MILNSTSDFEFFKNEWFGKDLPYLYVRIVKKPKNNVFYNTLSEDADEVPSKPTLAGDDLLKEATGLKHLAEKLNELKKELESTNERCYRFHQSATKDILNGASMDEAKELSFENEVPTEAKNDVNAENEVLTEAENGLYLFLKI